MGHQTRLFYFQKMCKEKSLYFSLLLLASDVQASFLEELDDLIAQPNGGARRGLKTLFHFLQLVLEVDDALRERNITFLFSCGGSHDM